MGREIKRVPLDFDWPLNKVWEGYLNSYYKYQRRCPFCEGTGLNPESKQIEDDWYDFDNTGRRWRNNITQDEVDALIAEDRLRDFTSRFVKGEGWIPTGHHPTADEINSSRGLIHNSINKWICVETRCRRLGVWGQCEFCKGEGELWLSEEKKQLAEEWEGIDPPLGIGCQVWETVSEGSPISPVFATAEEIVEWLVKEGYSQEAATGFVSVGWVPSMVVQDGKMYKDIESVVLQSDIKK